MNPTSDKGLSWQHEYRECRYLVASRAMVGYKRFAKKAAHKADRAAARAELKALVAAEAVDVDEKVLLADGGTGRVWVFAGPVNFA
jgi:branched-subunit amino acid aminotransferase/4-amino-4-deoxychorismate lyase